MFSQNASRVWIDSKPKTRHREEAIAEAMRESGRERISTVESSYNVKDRTKS